MTEVGKITARPPLEISPGVRAWPLFGEGAMLNLVDLSPRAAVALHRHPHEHLGIVLSGEITMTIDGVDHVLGEEDAYWIPGGVEHGGKAGPVGCRVLDIFHPVREDYRQLVSESR